MKRFTNVMSIIVCILGLGGNAALAGSGHSHGDGETHSHTPHGGIISSVTNSKEFAGYIEIKLHDDKGDLELWMTDLETNAPFDIPLDSDITVTFTDMDNKSVVLNVRNTVNNEDEDGNGNIRHGKTNYFIFPGDSGESADFLVGHDFSSTAVVSFTVGEDSFKTASFVLVPHTH